MSDERRGGGPCGAEVLPDSGSSRREGGWKACSNSGSNAVSKARGRRSMLSGSDAAAGDGAGDGARAVGGASGPGFAGSGAAAVRTARTCLLRVSRSVATCSARAVGRAVCRRAASRRDRPAASMTAGVAADGEVAVARDFPATTNAPAGCGASTAIVGFPRHARRAERAVRDRADAGALASSSLRSHSAVDATEIALAGSPAASLPRSCAFRSSDARTPRAVASRGAGRKTTRLPSRTPFTRPARSSDCKWRVVQDWLSRTARASWLTLRSTPESRSSMSWKRRGGPRTASERCSLAWSRCIAWRCIPSGDD